MQRGEMSIVVNGEPRRVPDGSTVRGLLELMGIRGAAAVERNLVLVPRARQGDEVLAEGDSLEVVQLVGGG
jgi:sulfur carrier protein